MASSTLSLKSLRDTNTLKSEISQLENEKKDFQAKLEREKKLVKKLQDDLVEQKKDFEHLEKQFHHFADIEAEFEALQHEVQMERLENLLNSEKVETQNVATVKKAREEIKDLQKELKELKKLDPVRLKRQVTDLKKKTITQANENKAVNTALVSARKELKETTAEKDRLDAELKAALNESHAFWKSEDGEWALFETGVILKGEDKPATEDERVIRIRCINLTNGASALSNALITEGDDKDLVSWHSELDIPEKVSKEAGKRLKKIAADLEDEDE
jgi:DNA repair exonuclease SbcCD ATPase subunit